MKLKNQKGQGMVEYLIIVCLIAVGTMAVIRVVGKNVSNQYIHIARALGSEGDDELKGGKITEQMLKKKDLTNFLKGAKGSQSDGDE
jgi:Flp pilus assembly pilin Flp